MRPGPGRRKHGCPLESQRFEGFTLIELILVMAVLAVVLGVAAPSLSRFFQGRKVEEEAMRFVALTHYAQSRAIHEGVPMILWLEPESGRYGVESEWKMGEVDPRAVTYEVDPSVRVEVELPGAPVSASDWWAVTWVQIFRGLEGQTAPGRYVLRFTPDGLPGPLSPERIRFVQETETSETVAVVRKTRNRLAYELERYEVPASQR